MPGVCLPFYAGDASLLHVAYHTLELYGIRVVFLAGSNDPAHLDYQVLR